MLQPVSVPTTPPWNLNDSLKWLHRLWSAHHRPIAPAIAGSKRPPSALGMGSEIPDGF